MNFDIFISEYVLILITMALVLFTTNEAVRLIDQVRIMWITHRVRKLASARHMRRPPASTPNDPTPEPGEAVEQPVWRPKRRGQEVSPQGQNRLDKIESWNMPSFTPMQWVGIVFGIIIGFAVLAIAYGILTYQP